MAASSAMASCLRGDRMTQFDLELFKSRLTETIAWCKPRVSMDEAQIPYCLRTPPYPDESLTDGKSPPEDTWIIKRDLKPISAFSRVVFEKRANAIQSKDYESLGGLQGGRLLLFDLDASGCDGTSPPESLGLLDGCDFTPWDTWVDYGEIESSHPYHRDYLISWIPQGYFWHTEGAIKVHTYKGLLWVEDAVDGFPFLEQLREAGLFFEPKA